MELDEKKVMYNRWVYMNTPRINFEPEFKAELLARRKKYFEDGYDLDQDVIDASEKYLKHNPTHRTMHDTNKWS